MKIHDDAFVRNEPAYLALGVLSDGTRDLPGSRGVSDILIAVSLAEELGGNLDFSTHG